MFLAFGLVIILIQIKILTSYLVRKNGLDLDALLTIIFAVWALLSIYGD
jgi:hypothetical protein